MNKPVLKALSSKRSFSEQKGEDIKSSDFREITNVDWVNEHRDFSKTTAKDLDAAFLILRERCPKSWTSVLERRAKELNRMFMMLKNGDTAKFVDPDQKLVDFKIEEAEAVRLMIDPKTWSMDSDDRVYELSEILRHLTIFAPFEGRPFVRAWLEALVPCFSRWILLSDSPLSTATRTLKNFLGAFGQPGIVVCLADRGANILQILQNSARSVEAVGRGSVEKYYWKCLAQSSCGGDPAWGQLARIKNKALEFSQLHYVTKDWLSDANDWCQIFANLVSPEISKQYERKIMGMFIDKEKYTVKSGPPKTLARCLAKGREYMSEFRTEQNMPRWANFAKQFESVYQRVPSKPEDFIWNIVDFARCSITVPGAADVMKVKRIIEEHFPVISVKNSYNSEHHVKGSGYRDLKLLIEVEFDDLQFGRVISAQQKTTLICEIQIISKTWLNNKITTSISYKILRAGSLCSLLYDAAKYVKKEKTDISVRYNDVTEIIKNGWGNLLQGADCSNINADNLLLTAVYENWDAAAVSLLVKKLGANMGVKTVENWNPLMYACAAGNDEVARMLVQLDSEIDHKNNFNVTALSFAAKNGQESCVRILLSARANVTVRDKDGYTALDYAVEMKHHRIVRLLKGEAVSVSRVETDKMSLKLDELKKAAIEGSLARFLDEQDIPICVVSKFLASDIAVRSLENLLQPLWFGGNIEEKDRALLTPLCLACTFGPLAVVSVLLKAGANIHRRDPEGRTVLHMATRDNSPKVVSLLLDSKSEVNVKDTDGWTALHCATRYNTYKAVSLLVKAKAEVNAENKNGWTPLLHAARYGNADMVAELLKYRANIHKKIPGHDVYSVATWNKKDSKNVLAVLSNHKSEI